MFGKVRQRIRESLGNAVGGLLMTMAGSVSRLMHVEGVDRSAEHLVWIYLGLMARADSISQIPLRISTGDDRLVDSGSLAALLGKPNDMQDGVAYLTTIEQWLALYNECQVAIVPDSRGGVLELVPLNPRYTKPIVATHTPTGTRMTVGYEYQDPQVGELVRLTRDEVISMVRPGPYDITRALWPEKPGRRTLQTDILAQEQNLAIFKNGGMPDVVFETEQQWDKDQADEFLERWQDRYGGTANSHKPGILYGGLKSKAIGLSPEDLQFFEGRKMSRSEQIALMRVKPAMVGLMEGETGLSQGSSTIEQYASWWRSVGLSELALISAAHQRDLVDRFSWSRKDSGRELTREQRQSRNEHIKRQRQYGLRSDLAGNKLHIWFDENEIEELAESRLQRVEAFGNLLDRGYRPDDINDFLRLRLPPHPTNAAMLPFNLQPVGDLVASPQREKRMPPADDRKLDRLFDGLESSLENLAQQREADDSEQREAAETPERWKGLRQALDLFVAEREKAAARKWSRYFAEQRSRVLDRYDDLVNAAGQREIENDVPLDETDLTPEGLAENLLPRGDEDELLAVRIVPLITRHLEDGYQFFGEQDEPGSALPDFSIDDPRVMEAIERRRIQAVKVNDSTERDLKALVAKGFTEGDSTRQLGERIADYYKAQVGETKGRPLTAAATQTTGIVNDGRMLAARSVGGLLKGWLHGGSREPRPEHLAAQSRYQEKPIPLDEQFVINGNRADAPGDASLPVSETANCKCMVTFHRAGEQGVAA